MTSDTHSALERRALLRLAALPPLASAAAPALSAAGTSDALATAQPHSSGVSITSFGARQDAADNAAPIMRAVAAAMNSGRTVFIPAGTFTYSCIDLVRNDAVQPVRLVITGPGTLRSTFKGTSIIASAGPFYDLVLDGVRFESEAGAGTRLIDGARFLRLIITPGTQFQSFDWVIHAASGYLQSIRLIGAIIRGGLGAIVQAPMAYDCVFAQNIMEFGKDGIVIDGQNDPAVHTCRIVDNLIEGMGGRAVVLGPSLATVVSGNYMEDNQGGDIFLNAGNAPHKGLRVQGNSIQMSRARLAAGAFAIVWGKSTALPVRSGDNFSTGPLHDTDGTTALIDMTGDYSAVRLYRSAETGRGAPGPPIGRAIYNDGLVHHVAWSDRYVALDPYHNELRLGGKHDSIVAGRAEPPVICYGAAPPSSSPQSFDRKDWARGSLVINARPEAGGTAGWICTRSGSPGAWSPLALGAD